MTNPVDQETTELKQRWLAQALALNDALAAKTGKLRHEIHNAERLHLRDLITLAARSNDQAHVQLERTRQQKKYLQQQLRQATQKLEECQQELIYTQQDLVDALKAERLTLRQATEVAKTLLAEDEPAREALTRLVNAIYGSTIKPWELQQRLSSSVKSGPVKNSDLPFRELQLSPEAMQFKAKFDQLRARFVALKSQLVRLKVQQGEINDR
jgi:seryl-tRNA synthetase